jgi:hypothetical protein
MENKVSVNPQRKLQRFSCDMEKTRSYILNTNYAIKSKKYAVTYMTSAYSVA